MQNQFQPVGNGFLPFASINLNDVLSYIGKASNRNRRAIEIALKLSQSDQLNLNNFLQQVLPIVPQRKWYYWFFRAVKNKLFWRKRFNVNDLPSSVHLKALEIAARECGKCSGEEIVFARESLYLFSMIYNGAPTGWHYNVQDNQID
ncbi:MAG: hypothetical protein FD170_3377 [Bacteroidetes bacterium]|nr:MAG: hypothetical protein FD170_3377 [Bacteroidota bacterium]